MKIVVAFMFLVLVLSTVSCSAVQTASDPGPGVSFQIFYDQLSPYGTWVDYQQYGYVWFPNVDMEFTPYGTGGHWIYTDDGWTWMSDYPWGWAPFHYGRWAYDESYGWLWVPQNEWGPAWVTWRRSAGYYGWAPLGPGITIDMSFGSGYRVPDERWIFVNDRDIGRADIDHHYVNRSSNAGMVVNSSVINNRHEDKGRHTTYSAGPAKDEVQKVTGRDVRPVAIQENSSPGQSLNNDQLRIYRPQFQTHNSPNRAPVPARVAGLKEITPVSQRNPGNQQRGDIKPAVARQDPAQPQTVKPPVIPAVNLQAPDLNPPNRTRQTELPSVTLPASPMEAGAKAPERGNVKSTEMQKLESPPKPRNARPSNQNGKGQQPWIGKQNERTLMNAPPVHPPVPGHPAAPGKIQPANHGKRVARPVVPPNNTGKRKDTQPVKENIQQHDSTTNHS